MVRGKRIVVEQVLAGRFSCAWLGRAGCSSTTSFHAVAVRRKAKHPAFSLTRRLPVFPAKTPPGVVDPAGDSSFASSSSSLVPWTSQP